MQLVKSPDVRLKTAVTAFDFNTLNAEEISKEMIALMTELGGIGLSANQVGLDAEIFVMKCHLTEEKEIITVINPVIEQVTINNEAMPEGCLSHPDLFLDVKRPRGIVAKYLDIAGNECIIELYDIDARCFLHEYDHLQGIEFTDRVSSAKLHIAKKKRSKLQKRKQHG